MAHKSNAASADPLTVVASVRAQVEGLRDTVAALKTKRRQIETQPVPMSEALDAIEAGLDRLERDAAGRFDNLAALMRPANGRPHLTFDPHPSTLPAMLVLVARDVIAERLRGNVVAAYESAGLTGITADDRRAALQELDTTVLAVEAAEELMIRRAEAADLEILRRGDANPAVVLAPAADLEAATR